MPEEGYRSITVREDLYKKLEEYANKTCRSIPKVVEYLLENGKEASS